MPEDSARFHDSEPAQAAVSADNPCPFLRALVANGFVDGHVVPLSKLSKRIKAASGERGLRKWTVGVEAFGVALIANGLSPLRLLRSLWSGAELDHLRNGPLDKHGGGSRILDTQAHVHEDEIDRLADFGGDWPAPGGGERGLNEPQIKAYMQANLQRDGKNARWYYPLLMKGEWPVLLRVMGKGDGANRYLSVAEVRTLFVERRFPERIISRLLEKPAASGGVLFWVGKAVAAVAALLLLAALAWIEFPDQIAAIAPKPIATYLPPALPKPEPAKAAYWLDQNWSTAERHWFHHVTQGTSTFPVPYAWFMALEQPYLSLFGSPGLLSDSAYLQRFGFIPSPKTVDADAASLKVSGYAADTDAKSATAAPATGALTPMPADNRDGLPVGFARLSGATDPMTGAAMPDKIGLTCAACHTGSIHYKGTSIRFDGGPAMVELRKLEKAMGFSMIFTLKVPGRFDRFAARVLGPNATQTDRDRLKKGLETAVDFALNAQAKSYEDTIKSKGQTETEEGFGRLDALNRIGNQVFYLDMVTSGMSGFALNQEAIAAPVSYPPIWTVPWFSWAQYDASISQPLIRNAGEALGVFASLNLSPEPPPGTLFRSTIAIENLHHIEEMLRGDDPFKTTPPALRGLGSPKWPEKLFPDDPAWKIDQARVANGRKLYAEICVECHLGPVADPVFDHDYPDKSFWTIKPANSWEAGWDANGPVLSLVEKPVDDMKTDPGQASILRNRMVKMPGFLGVDPAKDLQRCGLQPTSTTDMPYALALMDVVQRASKKWVDDHHLSDAERNALWGDRKNCPNPAPAPVYRARPLNGVWATAPYLHNGSVPSLRWMLTPAGQRPTSFCQGDRDYDPRDVGFRVPPGGETSCETGETLFATSDSNGPIKGNSVLGHSFEGPDRPNRDYPTGVIGRGFSDEERLDLIEYLKTL
jgi:mono/diheme cytochrome c family protein